MDVAGIVFSVVAEVRTVTQSIVRRVENFRRGRKAFKGLSNSLARLTRNIEEVDRLTGKFPHALPQDVTAVFCEAWTMFAIFYTTQMRRWRRTSRKRLREAAAVL